MPNPLQDLASKACDTAFQQSVITATTVLMTNLTVAAGDAAQVNDSRAKYQAALALCKHTHDMASAVIGTVFA